MKNNIRKEGIWWIHDRICDRCGENFGEWHTTKEPDTKLDFCYNCLCYFLDNDIPYSEVKRRYDEGEQI